MTDDAGLTLGMRWTPLDAVGLYVPGGKAAYPSSVLMNAMPARVAGVDAHRHVRAHAGRRAQPAGAGRRAPRRRGGDLPRRRRPGGRRAGLRHRQHRPGRPHRRPRQRLCRRGQAPGVRPCRHRLHRRPVRGRHPRRRRQRSAPRRHRPARPGRARRGRAGHPDHRQRRASPTPSPHAVAAELPTLPRAAIAGASWQAHGAIILVRDWDGGGRAWSTAWRRSTCSSCCPTPSRCSPGSATPARCSSARYCPEAVGDYVAGPNHVLPTGRTARFASGLSVFDFLKRTTWVRGGRRRRWPQVGPAAGDPGRGRRACRRTPAASRCGWPSAQPWASRPASPTARPTRPTSGHDRTRRRPCLPAAPPLMSARNQPMNEA